MSELSDLGLSSEERCEIALHSGVIIGCRVTRLVIDSVGQPVALVVRAEKGTPHGRGSLGSERRLTVPWASVAAIVSAP